MKFRRLIMDAKVDINTLSDEILPTDMANINELTYYIVGSAGVASGAVQPEEAHEVGYTGTWAANGSPISVVATAVKTVKISGVGHVGRCRISTAIGSGTVSVWAIGR